MFKATTLMNECLKNNSNAQMHKEETWMKYLQNATKNDEAV